MATLGSQLIRLDRNHFIETGTSWGQFIRLHRNYFWKRWHREINSYTSTGIIFRNGGNIARSARPPGTEWLFEPAISPGQLILVERKYNSKRRYREVSSFDSSGTTFRNGDIVRSTDPPPQELVLETAVSQGQFIRIDPLRWRHCEANLSASSTITFRNRYIVGSNPPWAELPFEMSTWRDQLIRFNRN